MEDGPVPGGSAGLYILRGDVGASWVRFPRLPLVRSTFKCRPSGLETQGCPMANVLKHEKQERVISALVEGSSIRSTERMTGVHRDTIMRLMQRVGAGCEAIMDAELRGLDCKRVQVDELWGFVQKKQRHVTEDDNPNRVGDFWTFVAIDADTKLVPTFKVGKRDAQTAREFMHDLASRIEGRVQISADALRAYVDAVDFAFGEDVDFGQIVKSYEAEPIGPGRYSPPKVIATDKRPVWGRSGPGPHLDELRRAEQPHDAHEHPAAHQAHQRFLKAGGESSGCRGIALRSLQFRAHSPYAHQAERRAPYDSCDGRWCGRPSMEARRPSGGSRPVKERPRSGRQESKIAVSMRVIEQTDRVPVRFREGKFYRSHERTRTTLEIKGTWQRDRYQNLGFTRSTLRSTANQIQMGSLKAWSSLASNTRSR